MEENRVFYGVGRLDLHIPHSRSLKDKRAVMLSLKGRLAERSHVSVLDVGSQDFWQRGCLAVCLIARDEAQARSTLAAVRRTVESDDRVVVLSFETRIGSMDDEALEGEGE